MITCVILSSETYFCKGISPKAKEDNENLQLYIGFACWYQSTAACADVLFSLLALSTTHPTKSIRKFSVSIISNSNGVMLKGLRRNL